MTRYVWCNFVVVIVMAVCFSIFAWAGDSAKEHNHAEKMQTLSDKVQKLRDREEKLEKDNKRINDLYKRINWCYERDGTLLIDQKEYGRKAIYYEGRTNETERKVFEANLLTVTPLKIQLAYYQRQWDAYVRKESRLSYERGKIDNQKDEYERKLRLILPEDEEALGRLRDIKNELNGLRTERTELEIELTLLEDKKESGKRGDTKVNWKALDKTRAKGVYDKAGQVLVDKTKEAVNKQSDESTKKKEDPPKFVNLGTKVNKDKKKTSQQTGNNKTQDSETPPKFVSLGKQDKNKIKKRQPSKPTGGMTNIQTTQSSGTRPKFVDKTYARGSGSGSQTDTKQGTGKRDNYRIVSISAETVLVTYGKQKLQKLKNINAAVIVIEIRGKQHIIDDEEAVSVLVEKGYFYRFPNIGLVATTKYNDFGGYSDGYDERGKGRDPFGKPVREGCAGKEPDISCKNYREKCGGVSSSSSKKVLRDSEGRTRRGSETNWKAAWCAQEKKICQEWYANGCEHKRKDFRKGMITFEASPEDAALYGGAVGPQSR